MSSDDHYLPFSQRTGAAPIPPQLRLGEVSPRFRHLVNYCFAKEVDNFEGHGINGISFFKEPWREVAMDFHVKLLNQPPQTFKNSSNVYLELIQDILAKSKIEVLFDCIEFFYRHPRCSAAFRTGLVECFVEARTAYRIIDEQIVAIGTEQQAEAFEAAVKSTEVAGAVAARKHLLAAGGALREGKWADSVRESIHAVESLARRIAPKTNTLGHALKVLEDKGYIHGSLKSAFEKLYGYTNDEGGIRHALLDDESKVDEADALFMLGACASFVSYLISRDSSDA